MYYLEKEVNRELGEDLKKKKMKKKKSRLREKVFFLDCVLKQGMVVYRCKCFINSCFNLYGCSNLDIFNIEIQSLVENKYSSIF